MVATMVVRVAVAVAREDTPVLCWHGVLLGMGLVSLFRRSCLAAVGLVGSGEVEIDEESGVGAGNAVDDGHYYGYITR